MADWSDVLAATRAVVDPSTSSEDLAAIAQAQKGLWVQIASHPNAYPALLDWLSSQGDENVRAAVASRQQPTNPSLPVPPPPPASEPSAALSAPKRSRKPLLIGGIGAFVVVVSLVVAFVVERVPSHGPNLTMDQFFSLSSDPQLAQFRDKHGVSWKESQDGDAKDIANDRADDLYGFIEDSEDSGSVLDCVSMIEQSVSHVTAAISQIGGGGDAYDVTLFRMDDENGAPTKQQMTKCSSEAIASFDDLSSKHGLGFSAHAKVTTQSGAVIIRFGYAPEWDTAALIVYGNVVALAGTEEGGDWTSELDEFTSLLISAVDQAIKSAPSVSSDGSGLGVLDSSVAAGDIVPFGVFSGQVIEWKVLAVEEGKALVITENAIALKPYQENTEPGLAATWETCTLRTWLNGEFLNSFTSEQADQIIDSSVSVEKYASNASGGVQEVGKVEDKFFLLSVNEVTQYFPIESERVAQYDGAFVNWWLRSPGEGIGEAKAVMDHNVNGDRGFITNYSFNGNNGVRPAGWITLG